MSQLSWSACDFLICICRQKESSLSLTSVSSWLSKESFAEYLPNCNWCAIRFPGFFLYVPSCFFLKHRWLKCPILLQCLHQCLLAGHLKPSMWGVSPHLWHLSACLFFSGLYFSCSCGGLSISFSSCWYLYLNGFGFYFLWFLWCLLGGNSVCWCLSKCTCMACGSFEACLMYFAVD